MEAKMQDVEAKAYFLLRIKVPLSCAYPGFEPSAKVVVQALGGSG